MITITRNTGYLHKLRKYEVVVDDVVMCNLASGETSSFEVPNGKHKIYLKIDWYKSNILEFDKTEKELEFECFTKLRGWISPLTWKSLYMLIAVFGGYGNIFEIKQRP